MRTHWTASLLLLIGACTVDRTTTETTATTGTTTTTTTGMEPTTSIVTPEVTTGSEDPATDTGDTITSTGEAPVGECLETLPPPIDCGEEPGGCGNATPIAGGPTVYIAGSALTRDDAWFLLQVDGTHCPRALYRVSKAGGDAHRIHEVSDLIDFEADDDAVYLVDRTEEQIRVRLSALVDGAVTVLGETHGDPDWQYWWENHLTRSFAGVVAYSEVGPKYPASVRLTPTVMMALASVAGSSLGSVPAYDGERVFFVWSDYDEPAVDRTLVALAGPSAVVLATNATPRGWSTVAVDGEHVYFATGDPTGVLNQPPELIGISRVAKSGGPATPLFPSAEIVIDQVLVDDTDVFFHDTTGNDIFAVAKSGGVPRRVWHGDYWSGYAVYEGRIHQDADDLYFTVQAPVGDLPVPGRDFLVRVAKNTVIP